MRAHWRIVIGTWSLAVLTVLAPAALRLGSGQAQARQAPPLENAQGKPFDTAQGRPPSTGLGAAPDWIGGQGRPPSTGLGAAPDWIGGQGRPFDTAQGRPFDTAQGRPRAVIRVKESATVRGSAILLGDIAQIVTEDQSLSQQLVALPIGQAPLPGLSRSFDPELITIKLRQYKIDPASLRIESPRSVMISSAHQLISSDELFQAAKRSVLADRGPALDPDRGEEPVLSPVEGAERVMVRAETLPPDLVVPPGSVELKARPRLASACPEPCRRVGLGSIPVVVEAWVDGRLYRSVSLSLRLSLLREVVVADRPLPPRTLLKASDVRLERRDIALLSHEPLRDLTSAIGQRTVRMLAMGEVVASDAVELPPLVRKGDLVTLTIERPGLLITAKGIAQEQGTAGQLVRVKTVGSGRAVTGKVEGEATVRVAF